MFLLMAVPNSQRWVSSMDVVVGVPTAYPDRLWVSWTRHGCRGGCPDRPSARYGCPKRPMGVLSDLTLSAPVMGVLSAPCSERRGTFRLVCGTDHRAFRQAVPSCVPCTPSSAIGDSHCASARLHQRASCDTSSASSCSLGWGGSQVRSYESTKRSVRRMSMMFSMTSFSSCAVGVTCTSSTAGLPP